MGTVSPCGRIYSVQEVEICNSDDLPVKVCFGMT